MAKTSPSATEGAADPATSIETEPCVAVTAPAGPHWRLGRRFGREAVTFDETELTEIGKPRGLDAEGALAELRADPMLAVVPDRRPKAPAAD